MLGAGRLDVGPRRLGAGQLEGDGDDLQTTRVKFRAQGLPPGQVEGAALIGSPGDQHDLLPAQ
jgi:hypothetical protein